MPESAAGRLIMASGTVLIKSPDAANATPGKTGDWLNPGQLISTGSDGRAQIRFSDGALVSLQPASKFRIDQYRFDRQEQRGFYSLLEGTIRAISGRIGKSSSDDFRLDTPSATIGIRGTEFVVQQYQCAPQCAPGQKDGLSVAVTQGRVFVYNAAGNIELPAGRATYVASPSSSPVPTASKPVLSPPPTRKEKAAEKARAEEEKARAAEEKAGEASGDPASPPSETDSGSSSEKGAPASTSTRPEKDAGSSTSVGSRNDVEQSAVHNTHNIAGSDDRDHARADRVRPDGENAGRIAARPNAVTVDGDGGPSIHPGSGRPVVGLSTGDGQGSGNVEAHDTTGNAGDWRSGNNGAVDDHDTTSSPASGNGTTQTMPSAPAGTKPGTNAGTGPGADAGSGAGTGSGADAGSGTGSGAASGARAGSGSGSGTSSDAGAGTSAASHADGGADVGADTGSGRRPGSDSGSAPISGSDPGSGSGSGHPVDTGSVGTGMPSESDSQNAGSTTADAAPGGTGSTNTSTSAGAGAAAASGSTPSSDSGADSGSASNPGAPVDTGSNSAGMSPGGNAQGNDTTHPATPVTPAPVAPTPPAPTPDADANAGAGAGTGTGNSTTLPPPPAAPSVPGVPLTQPVPDIPSADKPLDPAPPVQPVAPLEPALPDPTPAPTLPPAPPSAPPAPPPVVPMAPTLKPGETSGSSNIRVSLTQTPWFSTDYRFRDLTQAVLLDDKLQVQRVGHCGFLIACLHRDTAVHADSGNSGDVSWGRWQGGRVRLDRMLFDLQEALKPDTSIHYVAGTPTLTMPTEGSARYDLVGATSPTFGQGTQAPGSFTGHGFVQFGPGTGTRVALDGELKFGSTQHYRMTTQGARFDQNNQLIGTGPNGLRMNGSNTFSGQLQVQSLGQEDVLKCGGGDCRAAVDGAFFGEQAGRLGFTYSVANPQHPNDTDTINGAAVMGRVQP